MKRKSTKKRTYRSFFLRIFAVLFTVTAALETVAVIYKKKSSEHKIAKYYDTILWDIENWLTDADETEITETEIRKRFAQYCSNGYWIDSALVLYDRKEDRVYDSSRILLANVFIDANSTQEFEAYQKAAKAHPDTLYSATLDEDGGFYKSFISDDPTLLETAIPIESPDWDFLINADEIYAQGDTLKLGYFDVKHFKISAKRLLQETANPSYNLTNETRSSGDYVHFVKSLPQNLTEDENALLANSVSVRAVGSRSDSNALAEVYRHMNWNHGDSSIHPPGEYRIADMPQGYICISHYSEKLPFNKQPNEDFRWELYITTYYNFFLGYGRYIAHFSGILLVIILILSALITAIQYLKYSKVYEMNEYRRGLTAALAHDLKSPLTAISGYADNLRENVHTEKRNDYADAILKNAQYMDRIIADVLDLARMEQKTKIKTARTDLMQLAKEAAARQSAAAEEKALTLQLSGKCEIEANEKMMVRAIANLIENAVHYTPHGGCIDITGTENTLRIRNDAETAKIADPESLCEPFAKGDAARATRSGSGMGLAIVRQICTLHGFRLSISAKDGKFTAAICFK